MADDSLPVFIFGCASCGKTVSGKESSCPRCGASFEGVMFECPFCGELVSPTDRECGSCGTKFDAFAEEVSETSTLDLDGADKAAQETTRAGQGTVSESGPEMVEYECPACGKPVTESDTRCPHCGANFG